MKKVLILALLILPGFLYGAEPLLIPFVQDRIVFDGLPDEGFWSQVDPFPLIMQLPVFNGVSSESTEIRMIHDGTNLYLAGWLYHRDVNDIQATSFKRDAMVGNTDWFGIVIDTYNDKENALAFFTNPNGLRFDGAILNDAAGPTPLNLDWNNFWDVKCSMNEAGWFVEMRIPFTSLQFQETDGVVVMGISTFRYISKNNEVIMFPSISPTFGDFSAWKPSKMQEIKMTNVEKAKPFYIAPYVLGGMIQEATLPENGTEYTLDSEPKFEAGLDLKYGITNNLTLDVSVNTDFAQVEADDQQVNLTRFSLFFPEKRLFFQERSGIFEIRTGGPNRLFYSRRIGLDEDGNPVRILGGARLTGRAGSWDVGFLNMQTAKSDSLFSENFTVARVRKQILNANSYVGSIITNRMDLKGNYNTLYAVDGLIKVKNDDYLILRLGQTLENGKQNDPISLDPTRIFINYERRKLEGLIFDLSFSRMGKDYHPGMGFESRENHTSSWNIWRYGWLTKKESSKLITHNLFIISNIYVKNGIRKVESSMINPGWQFSLKSGMAGEVGWVYHFERVFEPFELDDNANVPIGDYHFNGPSIEFYTSPSARFWSYFQFQGGSFYDGTLINLNIMPTWNMSSKFELSSFYQYSRIRFSERNQDSNLHLLRLKGLYMFNTKLSLSAFIQINSADKILVNNFRLRYNPREGNDLYLVYNETQNNDRLREIPALPRTDSRAILLKYTYTIRL